MGYHSAQSPIEIGYPPETTTAIDCPFDDSSTNPVFSPDPGQEVVTLHMRTGTVYQ